MKQMLVRIAAVAAVGLGGAGWGRAGTITENFDTDPGWTTTGTGSNGNSFGYTTTSFAGGQVGEGGGRFTRSAFVRYYADTDLGGGLGLGESFQASGRLDVTAFNFPDFGPGLILGHFDPTGTAAVGLIFNTDDSLPGGDLYADAIILFSDGTEVRARVADSVSANVDRTWSYTWNPSGGVLGGGRLSVSLSGAGAGSAVVDLTPVDRLRPATFTGFGLFSGRTSPASGNPQRPDWFADVYIDDATYSVVTPAAVPEPASVTLACVGVVGLAGYARRRRG